MAYYLNTSGRWSPYRDAALDVRTELPSGNYVIKIDMHKNMFLEPVDAFELPTRLYGDVPQNTRRIIRTFQDRPASTGVLLAGSKGSGKTLLSKNVCHELTQLNVPTIIVNSAFCGDEFNEFIQRIEQPAVILFDEFEKVYKRDEQPQLLTLLDGVFSSKKLFLLTCNDIFRVDQHMQNRPGRIFYTFRFGGLEKEHIVEYCNDNLYDKQQINAICRVSNIFGEFNFDMLAAMVEEMNRYNETPQEVLRVLNILPENDSSGTFAVTVVLDGITYHGPENFYDDEHLYHGSPVLHGGEPRSFTFYKKLMTVGGDEENAETKLETVYFSSAHFCKFDQATQSFHFDNGTAKLVLTKQKTAATNFNYQAF